MTPVITIQPFTADHTSMPFTCGVRRIDDYFAHGALIQKERLARLFIALDRATRRTALGFYALHIRTSKLMLFYRGNCGASLGGTQPPQLRPTEAASRLVQVSYRR